jgi:peroxiredoxin Q/BCP
MAGLKVGQSAPRFSLKDKDGKAHSLDTSKVDYTVLYFYPKDDTPGCTLEAKEFSQFIEKFASRNVRVVGVSGGDEKSKAKFCAKYSLKVPLVSDTNFKVARSYGAYGTKQFMGRTFQGIFRKTFLVDKAGKIARIFDTVKPEGHAQEVLAAIDELSKKGGAKKVSVKPAPKTKKAPAKKAIATKSAVKRGAKTKSARAAAPKRAARKATGARGAKKATKKK